MIAKSQSAGPKVLPLLAVRNLTLNYRQSHFLREDKPPFTAFQDVSFDVFPGRTVGLIGPSGSGKSSIARCIVLLERPTGGQIFYEGRDLTALKPAERKKALNGISIVFQDSSAALNPGFTVEDILLEPFVIQNRSMSSIERKRCLLNLLERVQLHPKTLQRYPAELSGGQRQRVAIARGIATRPKLLLLDEPFSALDLSTQGQIANLLLDLREIYHLAFLLITHDVDRAVLLAMDIVELSPEHSIRTFRGPLSSVHGIDPF